MEWVNAILQGVLLGGLYALFAAGLSLIFGVMRLVNIAHGDLIVLAAYLALVATQALGIGPLTALLLVVPAMAAIGYALQRGLLNRTLGDDLLPPLLVTFGLRGPGRYRRQRGERNVRHPVRVQAQGKARQQIGPVHEGQPRIQPFVGPLQPAVQLRAGPAAQPAGPAGIAAALVP